MTVGDPDPENPNTFTAQYPDAETGKAAGEFIIDKIWAETDGNVEKFVKQYSGLDPESEEYQTYLNKVEDQVKNSLEMQDMSLAEITNPIQQSIDIEQQEKKTKEELTSVPVQLGLLPSKSSGIPPVSNDGVSPMMDYDVMIAKSEEWKQQQEVKRRYQQNLQSVFGFNEVGTGGGIKVDEKDPEVKNIMTMRAGLDYDAVIARLKVADKFMRDKWRVIAKQNFGQIPANRYQEYIADQDTFQTIADTAKTAQDQVVPLIQKYNERVIADHNALYEDIQKDAREWEVESAKKLTSAESLLEWSTELTKQIVEVKNIDTELAGKKEELKKYEEEIKIVDKEKERLTSDDNYHIIAKQLLQDSGIKTKVIKRYLPIMNKLINGYLNKLEFQVKFDLDEQFNETIKSRYRDEFSYANFSEGEKMRIDLALLFTWRQIAKMKNSTNTNLLILDEIFDSSLDANGTDEFLKILSTLTNENIFLVSHKSDLNVDKFDYLIRFEKIQNFTRMTT